jgi:AmmeMemoRadiSam system protein B
VGLAPITGAHRGGVVVRPPAVAGRFYPASAEALTAMVDSMLAAVAVPADEPLSRAYVVPHAGYRYSGPTAAHVYQRLRTHPDEVHRIVLIGPAHFKRLAGCAVPAAGAWLTPLGPVEIDAEACAALVRAGHAVMDDEPHAPEHSLEVQLPFLQRALADRVRILPIVAGPSTVDTVAAAIAAAVGGGETTVVICSTDLSHYQDDVSARRQDERTMAAVVGLDPDQIGVRDACGVYALRGLVGWARRTGLTPSVLHRCTSADTAGDASRVVGYAALSLR